MNWLILFGTTWLYQVILGATFARVFDASLFPRLSLLWVCVLADRDASSPARETETWLSGLFASCFLGYMLDVHFVAPRGMHMSLYGLSFIAVRLLVTRLGQALNPRLPSNVLTVEEMQKAFTAAIKQS